VEEVRRAVETISEPRRRLEPVLFLEEQDRFEASPWFTYGFNGAAYFLHERP